MCRLKSLFICMLVAGMLLSRSPSVKADAPPPADITTEDSRQTDGQTLQRNTVKPGYVPTAEELARIAHKNAQATQEMRTILRDAAPLGFVGKILSVGTWLQPNDWAHRNYCGPAATQVALDARLPAAQVPDIETIAQEENLDPNLGVWLTDIKNVLNTRLSTDYYVVESVGSQQVLASRLMYDINRDYAMVTGCHTGDMPGWSVPAKHIVAVYGYSIPGSGTAYYVETAGSVAGYTGSYRQSASIPTMYTYVSGNPWHIW